MIEIDSLKKRFGSSQVLDGLSLTVNTGETLVILGRSGVGKSVLLKHIIGITKPDEGTIDVDGVRISDLSGVDLYKAIKEMGMLFQGAALFDSMTIAENTAFYLTQHSQEPPLSIEERDERVNKALEMVGLEGTQDKMPSELSGGMRKRAGLARLIVYRPKVLLYDEPTTGLDPITSMQINKLILETQRELGATSIVVTHDIVSALYIADRLALHKDGKIAYIDEPDAFMRIEDPIIDFLRETIERNPREMRENR